MATIIPINKAEAIFAPLFDDKIILLNEFKLIEYGAEDGRFQKSFDFYHVYSKASKYILRWQGDIQVEGYDCLRFFLNFSQSLTLSSTACVNGKDIVLFENIRAGDAPIEPTSMPIFKRDEISKLTKIDLIFEKSNLNIVETQATISWLGLLASWREHIIEDELPRYDEKWEGLLNKNGTAYIENNILFAGDEFIHIKSKLHTQEFKPMFDKIIENAKAYENYAPEPEIREYLEAGLHLYRYVRVRDRGRQSWANMLVDLAIAGYLCDNKKWSNLAARIVLSIVHTPYWFEGPVFRFPGSDFHDVCFLEEAYVSAISKAMGFLGDILTPKAKELVLKRVEENWKWVDFKCSEPGYRLFMNQGLVGNYGRIAGAYYLYLSTGKYENEIERAYSDHTRILDNYLTDEGHCTEGPAYYQYSFGTSMYLWMMYAKYKNSPVPKVIPQRFVKSANYVDAFMSAVNEYGMSIPVSNGQVGLYNQLLLMFMTNYCDYSMGNEYIKNRLEKGGDENSSLSTVGILFYIYFKSQEKLIEGNTNNENISSNTNNNLIVMKNGGVLSYKFYTKDEGKLLFLCERNPLTGHYHYDRGSFVLEANGKVLFADLGTTNYSNMNAVFMKNKEYHSTVYPLNDKMTVISKVGEESAKMAGHNIKEGLTLDMLYTPEAEILFAEETENGVHFKANLAPLYSKNVICGTREGKLSVAENSGILELIDEWQFNNSDSLNANFVCSGEWEIINNSAKAMVDGTKVEISFVEENGNDLTLEIDNTMTDYANRFVSVLRVKTGRANFSKLISKIKYFDGK